ncbi:MAG: type II secretion system F family protein [Planctomycetota bacterium]|nr:type II secretion system F family protein [Planctomycetota bacterium]MDA1211686.1 type II secretion system F family protein [Planctomycetota bacterium]
MSNDVLLIMGAAFVGMVALVMGVAAALRNLTERTTEDRLQVLTGKKSDDDEAVGIMKEEVIRDGAAGLTNAVASFFQRLGNMKVLFEQADCPIRIETFFAISVGCVLIFLAIAAATYAPVPLFPVAALFGGSLPWFWLLWRRKRRFKKFANQLPDALELIARALRSGHSLASGLHVVVDEMPSPVSEEFGAAYEEQNLGVPIDQALKNMLTRMPNLDLKFFVTAVVIQRQAGGDLAEILDKIGYIIRERFKIIGQVQALTGEGRISGVVLMGLPIVLFFAVYHLNPQYVMLLFTEELGRKMIAAAVVLQILGAVSIKKIVNIKV